MTATGVMAGRQRIEYGCFRIIVKPHYWLRRRFPFLPFFESTNPSFRIEVKCVGLPHPGEEWKPGEQLVFTIAFPDNTTTTRRFPVPVHLRLGDKTSFVIHNVLCPIPGRMVIRFPITPPNGSFHTAYAYTVHAEERIWYPFFALAFTLAGVAIQRWLHP